MKKICFLIPSIGGGGAERAVSRLSFILKDSYDLTVVYFYKKDKEFEIGCKTIFLDIKRSHSAFSSVLNIFSRIKEFNRVCRENNFDMVISFLDTANMTNLLSSGNHKKAVAIVNYVVGEISQNGIMNRLSWALFRICLGRADRIFCVAEGLREMMIEHYGVKSQICRVLYTAYDIEKLNRLAGEDTNKKQQITALGRFAPQKGYDCLIRTFASIADSYEGLVLKIIGASGEERINKLSGLAQKCGVGDRVKLLPFINNPYPIVGESLVFVLSSRFEGFPNVLCEAMSLGVPVVATGCRTGPGEILDMGRTGIKYESMKKVESGILTPEVCEKEDFNRIVPDKSELEMARGIKVLLDDPELRMKYSAAAKLRMEDFSYENIKNAYIREIGDTLKER